MPKRIHGPQKWVGKYPVEKLYTLNNFIPAIPAPPTGQRGKYYCYVGRLSEEKGVETLLEAATMLQHELRIAGSGPLYGKLKAKYDSWPQNPLSSGQLDSDGVWQNCSGEAACSVLPSECYRKQSAGHNRVIMRRHPGSGAEIGGIPELIDDNNGLTFAREIPRHLRRQ